MRCGSENTDYTAWFPVVAVFTLVYAIGTPIFFTLLVQWYRERGEKGEQRVQTALGWIYEPYKHGCDFWFGLEMLRVTLLSSLIGFFATACWPAMILRNTFLD